MSNMWQVRQDNHGRMHVVPVEDLREHEPHDECWCSPRVEEDGGVIIHAAMDMREKFERGERKPS